MQRPAQYSRIGLTHAFEAAVDEARKTTLGVSRAQQPRPHHWRQRQRYYAGYDHRTREGKCKLPEQRASQTALNADGRIHCGEGDRHGDDWADQFPGCILGRLEGGLAHVKMPLDVLYHYDRVIHHQAD